MSQLDSTIVKVSLNTSEISELAKASSPKIDVVEPDSSLSLGNGLVSETQEHPSLIPKSMASSEGKLKVEPSFSAAKKFANKLKAPLSSNEVKNESKIPESMVVEPRELDSLEEMMDVIEIKTEECTLVCTKITDERIDPWIPTLHVEHSKFMSCVAYSPDLCL